MIALKENRPALCADSKLCFRDFKTELPVLETIEKGHARIEKRTCYLLTHPEKGWEYGWSDWKNLQGIGMVHSEVTENGETREDAARARKENSPLNMNILRKLALSLMNDAKYGRISKKKTMFRAALNSDVLLAVLFSLK